ncbi:MAG: vitamin K epoxide reductase family protein [Leptonema sp. (in: bacteria)]
MNKKNKIYFLLGSLISIFGVILSILLVCKHSFPDICPTSLGCNIEGVDGCKELGQSEYSKIFGIPIAFFGLVYYLFLGLQFFISFLRENVDPIENHSRIRLVYYFSIIGLGFDGILAYINFKILIVPCLLCVYSYFITLSLFFISLVLKNRNKPQKNQILILKNGFTMMGVAVVVSSLIMGFYYVLGESKNTNIDKNQLVPKDKIQEYLKDFYSLKDANLDTKGLKTYEGNPKGYIVIHKFADFLCPHCLHTVHILKKVLQRWPDRIVIYYRQFPLDSTCNSEITSPPRKPYGDWRCNGAQAAVCADEYPNFSDFYHSLFALQEQQLPIDLEQLERISKNLNIPWQKLFVCMTSAISQEKINKDVKDAKRIDINSTPTLVINNKLVFRGTPDETYFFHLLDSLVFEKEGEKAFEEFKERSKNRIQK